MGIAAVSEGPRRAALRPSGAVSRQMPTAEGRGAAERGRAGSRDPQPCACCGQAPACKRGDPRQRPARRRRAERCLPPRMPASTCATFAVASSYIIYSKDNIKVILKTKTTFFTFIKFAGASHMPPCKLQYCPQGSDPHVTLGRWNILFIPPRL